MAKRTATPQTSTKLGIRSLAQKQESTRHAFDPVPAARPKPGAHGEEDRVRGRDADASEAASRGKRAAIRKMKEARLKREQASKT